VAGKDMLSGVTTFYDLATASLWPAPASTLTKNTWLCMIIHSSVDQIIK
jgi:hypothetical protein